MNMSNKKFKILYHHRTQGRGAEGVHITSIVKALEGLGHDVTIVSPPGVNPLLNAGNAPVDKSQVKTSGIDSLWKFISKHIPNILFEFIEVIYNFPASIRLEKELSVGQYDLIYERYAFYMLAGVRKARKYNIPFVLEANEVNRIKDRARKQSMPLLCNYFEKYLFRHSTSIHTVSSYLKNMISLQGIDKSKIVVSPNAIDPDKFDGKIERNSLIDKYNLQGKTVLGFSGWFDDWDRLDLLIDVFSSLKTQFDNIVLLLVGDGAVLDVVRDKINDLDLHDSVILTGAVARNEISQYLSLLDVAVITHSNEFGSPVIMFEFMGLGIPIVAPKLLPITDVLSHNDNSLLFNVLDMNDLKSQLSNILNDEKLRARLSLNAHKKLMSHHTWEKNAEDIILSSGLM